jgi:hypothetical protein
MKQEIARFMQAIKEVTDEQTAREKVLQQRYPWFNVVYNYIVALVLLGLMWGLFWWAIDVWAQNKADEQSAAALSAYQAEQQAIAARQEEARKAAENDIEKVINSEAETVAKAYEGIKLFIEKYHYTDADLDTYARCMFNRVDAGNGVNSLHVIVSRPLQFTGYSDENTIQAEYKALARKLVTAWHEETEKPCDLRYQYAELTPEGIFLTMEVNAGPYARRWHA